MVLKQLFSIFVLITCLLLSGVANASSADKPNNTEKKAENTVVADATNEPDESKEKDPQPTNTRIEEAPYRPGIDSTDINSLSKFNFIFYFIYKYKYEDARMGTQYPDL